MYGYIIYLNLFIYLRSELKLTVLNLTTLGAYETDSIVIDIVKVSNHQGNIDMISYHKKFKVPIPSLDTH